MKYDFLYIVDEKKRYDSSSLENITYSTDKVA